MVHSLWTLFMTHTIPTVDVRTMKCPEPFKTASAHAMALRPGESFCLKIGIEPLPLYEYLEKQGFAVVPQKRGNGEFEVLITALEEQQERVGEIPLPGMA